MFHSERQRDSAGLLSRLGGPCAGARLAIAAAAWLALAGPAQAQPAPGLSYELALLRASERAPLLAARRATLDAATQLRTSAGQLPDPRLTVGLGNLPISGPKRFNLAGEPMTQRTVGYVQEVPNAAKRAAQRQGAEAREQRAEAVLATEHLAVQREVALAWLGRWYAEQRLAVFGQLDAENRLLRETVDARVAAGSAMPLASTRARQEALLLADRRDELTRERAQAQAALARWLDDDADQPLAGAPPVLAADPAQLLHGVTRHADLQVYAPMERAAQADIAEAEAAKRGDWGWQVSYGRRGSSYGDVVSVQFSFGLPLWAEERQDPQIAARLKEGERIAAEREDMLRRRREEVGKQLAELDELGRKAARLRDEAVPLAAERVTLALAAFEANRGDLAGVLAARRERAELDLRALELEARQQALRARLNYLIAENR